MVHLFAKIANDKIVNMLVYYLISHIREFRLPVTKKKIARKKKLCKGKKIGYNVTFFLF